MQLREYPSGVMREKVSTSHPVWAYCIRGSPEAQVILAEEKLAEDVNLSSVAGSTDGYSGSDLRQVCTAAAMRPVRELLKVTGKSSQNKVISPFQAYHTLHLMHGGSPSEQAYS